MVTGVAISVETDRCGPDLYAVVWYHLEWIMLVIYDEIPDDVCFIENIQHNKL